MRMRILFKKKEKNIMGEKLAKVWNAIKRVASFIGFGGLLHIETEALIVLVAPKCFGYWAIIIALLFGIGKELYDIFVKKSKIGLSLRDLLMDSIGILLGVLVSLYR